MEDFSEQRVLVIAAHPDDETLGAGGTIARFSAKGSIVKVIYLGEGTTARFPKGDIYSDEAKDAGKKRTESALQALKILGVKEWKFGERLCTQFDSYNLLELVKEIESEMVAFRPSIILTHNKSDVNIDHRITNQAVEVATRPYGNIYLRGVYSFEIVCSSSWVYEQKFDPNLFVDIEPYMQTKLQAWAKYDGENRAFPFPRSEKGLITLANYRGMMSGLAFAEGFRVMRAIRRNE
jgi:LmbE family N-acetylglucosaminyl deacetylase